MANKWKLIYNGIRVGNMDNTDRQLLDLLNNKMLFQNLREKIKELEDKIVDINAKIQISDKDIGEWNDMNELFTKTLRYNLLDTHRIHLV